MQILYIVSTVDLCKDGLIWKTNKLTELIQKLNKKELNACERLR